MRGFLMLIQDNIIVIFTNWFAGFCIRNELIWISFNIFLRIFVVCSFIYIFARLVGFISYFSENDDWFKTSFSDNTDQKLHYI